VIWCFFFSFSFLFNVGAHPGAIDCTLLWQSELTEEELKVIVTHLKSDYSDFLTMLGLMLV
jgi:hypothetical protein